jgi:UrcA family protein
MILFTRRGALVSRLTAALALGALTFMSTGAYAADLDVITISAPNVKTVGRDVATGAPIEEVTKQATLKVDPVTLTTNSGVALIKDSVRETARKLCDSIDPLSSNDPTCVNNAVKPAMAQVDAATARARSTQTG